MHKLFVTLAALGVIAAPAVAQNAQAAQSTEGQAQVAPTEKPKMARRTSACISGKSPRRKGSVVS